jgi:imidazole glycerol-phosphate synthase subunit HisF
MLSKRIIPCLDIKDGQTVKGVNFVDIRYAGDPVELGSRYSDQGADELVYLDITATHENRKLFVQLVRRIAEQINIPFTVGGGISHIRDAEAMLTAGADKISVNSAAINDPEFISQISRAFGSQFIVVAIDAKLVNDSWVVHRNGGRIPTSLELYSWAKEVQDRGCGEILFTSMDHDGTKNGFACDALALLADQLSIPVIASGGAGTTAHFYEVFTRGRADAALAASIFHFGEIPIPELKQYLRDKQIEIRP